MSSGRWLGAPRLDRHPLPRASRGGWHDAQAQSFSLALPLDAEPGTAVFGRVRAIDADGVAGIGDSPHLPVVADTTPPVIADLSLRLAGSPVQAAFIGEDVYFEVRASDAETGIHELAPQARPAGHLPGPLAATLVTGTTDLYRSGVFSVPETLTAPATVTAHLRVTDRAANQLDQNLMFTVGPEHDAAAPQARWRVPWQGALWPASYTSTVSPNGTTLLLRLYGATSTSIRTATSFRVAWCRVEVRGPVRDVATSEVRLADG